MFDRIATPLITVLMFVAVPGSAEEPEKVLLNNKVLVCDAEGCTEILAEDTEVQTSEAEPIIEPPELKPEPASGPESGLGPTLDERVVEPSVDEPAAPENQGNIEPDDRGAQWMMWFGALGILGLAGFVFWTTAWKRNKETAKVLTADETSETDGTPGSTYLSVRNISILDDRFSKFEIEIANADQSPAASVTIDARIIIHRLEADPGDASVTAEKSANEIMRDIPGGAADKVTLGILLYRGMFKARTNQTAYDVEVNGTMRWKDGAGESREHEFSFCAPAITGDAFNGEAETTRFAMLPGPILEHYAENLSA